MTDAFGFEGEGASIQFLGGGVIAETQERVGLIAASHGGPRTRRHQLSIASVSIGCIGVSLLLLEQEPVAHPQRGRSTGGKRGFDHRPLGPHVA
jgi:hypothetical protein